MKYRALSDTLISHESRVVKAGDVFETTFPKVKTKDGEVDMKLGSNLELVKEDEKADDKKVDKKAAKDLV